MASFSVSTKVEPDADEDCVAEEEVFHFSYLLHSLVIHSFLLLQCDYRIRANANLLPLLALQSENFDDFTIASPWERFVFS